jgi:hypothetical protein
MSKFPPGYIQAKAQKGSHSLFDGVEWSGRFQRSLASGNANTTSF